MASHSVAAGKVGAYDKTLVANTPDKVTFADDVRKLRVLSDGTAPIFLTVDAADPTVGDTGAEHLPAMPSQLELESFKDGSTVVRLISAGTPVYSVARVQ